MWEKVIKGLEICSSGEWNSTGGRDHTSCPYYPAGYTGCTCKLLMRDALALLKAQEPRVMTLEEALGGDECWIEGKNGACGYGDALLTDDGERVDFYRAHSIVTLDFYEYGLSWRCWTSRPTDEQRKAAKWDDA